MKWNWVFAATILLGCTTSDCKYARNQPKETAVATEATPTVTPSLAPSSVKVFKYDGSKQCEMKSGRSLDTMEKDLKGIQVLSRERKNDGKMRIQMCGADTGWANVYEVPVSDKEKAIKRGFQEWKL